MLLSITEFLGHFHPLLVHLPIGILLVALLLQWMGRKEKYKSFSSAVPVVLLAGALSALAACITGYLLSISDDYDESLVSWHMWMGIATALVSLMLYAKEKNPQFAINKKILSLGLLVLIFVTGHLGGSLTHGSDYLSKPLKNIFSNDTVSAATIQPLANVQEAMAYTDVVKPILATKCYSCHGANKQKGGLRMDDSLRLMKGGKDGKIILPGNTGESELIKRLLLPVDNDDHMPPKEKPQPTEQQIALLQWWISQGAGFDKKVKDMQQDEKIRPALLALQNAAPEIKESSYLPAEPAAPADAKLIQQLKQAGILVLPVAQNSNYLKVSFITDTTADAKDMQLITQLKEQLVSLQLSNTNADDSALTAISQCTTLVKLFLDSTRITDYGLAKLNTLSNLRYLNLVGTNITSKGLMQLTNLKNLQSLYLYQTKVAANDWAILQQAFPKTYLDSGGYIVPILASDTTELKAKKKY
ncbi:MAG TPA: hypothetical protein PL045_00025 [Chitinophagaceae bacterium]|nr:hypothetical protein [Chitinophagaceae bacterium]